MDGSNVIQTAAERPERPQPERDGYDRDAFLVTHKHRRRRPERRVRPLGPSARVGDLGCSGVSAPARLLGVSEPCPRSGPRLRARRPPAPVAPAPIRREPASRRARRRLSRRVFISPSVTAVVHGGPCPATGSHGCQGAGAPSRRQRLLSGRRRPRANGGGRSGSRAGSDAASGPGFHCVRRSGRLGWQGRDSDGSRVDPCGGRLPP